MTDELIEALRPDPDELLALLAAQVDDSMLRVIAEADHGEDVEHHLTALVGIRDAREIPAPMGFEPREVLELIRWSEPDDPRWRQSDEAAVRDHVMRAFCCAVLVRAGGEEGNPYGFDSEPDTLAQLLGSLDVLGEPYQRAALRLLAWRFARLPVQEEDRPFYLLAMLVLCLKIRTDLAPRSFGDMVAALLAEEEAVRTGGWALLRGNPRLWLLGIFSGQRNEVWRTYGAQLRQLAQTVADEPVRESILGVAERLGAS